MRRAALLFDRVVVAILVNEQKTPLLPQAERVELARAVFAEVPRRRGRHRSTACWWTMRRVAGPWRSCAACASAADVEYELPMTLMNRHLRPSLETVFLPTAVELGHISSRLVKEVWRLGGDIRGLVPPAVEARLRDRRLQRT